jgi:glycosyltransferase involved in cell wall biosynthesis
MKILLAHNNYHITGGAEVFFHEIGRVLGDQGHEVAYLSSSNSANGSSPWSSYFVKAPDYAHGALIKRISQFGQMVYSFDAKAKAAKLIRDFKPDIVHAFAIYVKLTPAILDACREAGVPVVMSCNDYKHICPNYKMFHHGYPCEECKDGRFYRATFNRCCQDSMVFSLAGTIESYLHRVWDIYRKNIHTFLFASQYMARKTTEFWGRDSFRWRLLRNPFDGRQHPLSVDHEDYFLYFGRLIDEKGVDVLLRAMQQVPQARLLVIGDGPGKEELEALGAALGLKNVDFLGPRWGEEMDRLLRRCRFVVVPSLWNENFPYVILQAFAMGKAVIGTDRGGIPELVRHGESGLIYPALDSAALAQSIREFWDNPDLAVTMGKAAKSYVDAEFNDDKFYRDLMNVYETVLA